MTRSLQAEVAKRDEPDASAGRCPLCQGVMVVADEAYAMDEIFKWWEREGTVFSAPVRHAHGAGGRVTLWTCTTCGLGRFEPIIAGSAIFYDELERSTHEWYYRSDKWEFVTAIQAVARLKARRLLEVGCGDGQFLALAAARCSTLKRLVGLELNPAPVVAARQRGFDVRRESLEAFAANSTEPFDVVCAFQVLEHVSDPAQFLRTLRRLTAPGGSVLLGMPNQDGPIRHVRPYLHDLPPHHLTRWRPETFLQGVTRLGFRVVEWRAEPLAPYHYRWLLPVYAARLGGSLLQLPLRLAGAALARVCLWLRLPHLPLRGHTLFVRLEPQEPIEGVPCIR